jgi:hypothetical protein
MTFRKYSNGKLVSWTEHRCRCGKFLGIGNKLCKECAVRNQAASEKKYRENHRLDRRQSCQKTRKKYSKLYKERDRVWSFVRNHSGLEIGDTF